jgi:catechol 2,3-dioxygenase-like lactoylglutathione lyase family enzyme
MKLTQIKETCLYINDLAKAKHFYNGQLGLPLISEVEGRHIFFRVGTSVLLCFIPEVTKAEDKLPPHFAYGPQHLAFEVPQEEYEGWRKKIEGLNIPITHVQEWKDGLTSFYFDDPFGNVLEIVPNGIWE